MGFDQVTDLPGEHTVQVGLHDTAKGLVDAAAAFQQRREERPAPQFRDPKFQVPEFVDNVVGRVPLRGLAARALVLAPVSSDASAPINSCQSDSVATRIQSVILNSIAANRGPLLCSRTGMGVADGLSCVPVNDGR